MSDFTANVKAVLDTTGISSQINKEIENLRIQLKNVTVDAPSLASQIQEELNKNKFTIKLDGVSKEAKIISEDITKSMSKSIKATTPSMRSLLRDVEKANKAVTEGRIGADLAGMKAKIGDLKSIKGLNIFSLKTDMGALEAAASNVTHAVQSSTPDNAKIQAAWNAYISALNKTKNTYKTLSAQSKTFGGILRRTSTEVATYVASFMSLQKTIDVLKLMYKNVVAVDSAMINLKKVTNETPSAYSKYMKQSMQDAKSLGRTADSYIEQTANWAKLGYTTKEAAELAKVSSIYANVGELSDAEAVSDLVTAMKAFNIEAGDAIAIVDSLNNLGNNFAVTSEHLGDGLSVSASSLALAGNDLHQTLAMLTGMSEITQNANEAGNALKIGSMRIRGMKGELEALGEEVDSNVDSISKVQTQILNLTSGVEGFKAVNIFDAAGNFRDYYDIMKDISAIYDKLDSTKQASLMELLFGKQRGNQGAALIKAFQSGQIEKAYNMSAFESNGSAMREQEAWMEGLVAKTNQLKAAWQELSVAFLKSDFLGGTIDSLTRLTELLTWLINNIGTFNTLLTGLGINKARKSIS